jgi:hypothetical protein
VLRVRLEPGFDQRHILVVTTLWGIKMTDEERDLITKFVQRVGGRAATSSGFAGSVPTAGGPQLPPVDQDADKLLADLYIRYPEARYRITQLAFVQEHAVAAATNQISQLQAQITQLQQQLQSQSQQAPAPGPSSPWGQVAQQGQPQQAPSRGIFGGLFGGGQPAAPAQPQYQQPGYGQPAYAPPPPQYAPGYQPGMFQRSGSGFLGTALTTAAGVAGGMMAANALSGLFSGGGHREAAAASFGGDHSSSFGQANLAGEAAPWANPSLGAPDPLDQGGEAKDYSQQSAWNTQPDTGWQNAAPQDSGWTDASNADSGWSDTSSYDPDNT